MFFYNGDDSSNDSSDDESKYNKLSFLNVPEIKPTNFFAAYTSNSNNNDDEDEQEENNADQKNNNNQKTNNDNNTPTLIQSDDDEEIINNNNNYDNNNNNTTTIGSSSSTNLNNNLNNNANNNPSPNSNNSNVASSLNKQLLSKRKKLEYSDYLCKLTLIHYIPTTQIGEYNCSTHPIREEEIKNVIETSYDKDRKEFILRKVKELVNTKLYNDNKNYICYKIEIVIDFGNLELKEIFWKHFLTVNEMQCRKKRKEQFLRIIDKKLLNEKERDEMIQLLHREKMEIVFKDQQQQQHGYQHKVPHHNRNNNNNTQQFEGQNNNRNENRALCPIDPNKINCVISTTNEQSTSNSYSNNNNNSNELIRFGEECYEFFLRKQKEEKIKSGNYFISQLQQLGIPVEKKFDLNCVDSDDDESDDEN